MAKLRSEAITCAPERVAQSCSAFWNYSAAFTFSQHSHSTIADLRTAEWGQLRPNQRYPLRFLIAATVNARVSVRWLAQS